MKENSIKAAMIIVFGVVLFFILVVYVCTDSNYRSDYMAEPVIVQSTAICASEGLYEMVLRDADNNQMFWYSTRAYAPGDTLRLCQ